MRIGKRHKMARLDKILRNCKALKEQQKKGTAFETMFDLSAPKMLKRLSEENDIIGQYKYHRYQKIYA